MKTEPIEFTVNNLVLRGNIYHADKPNQLALLFVHGWTGMTNEAAAELMAANGFSCMTFSLSGHNNSEGKIEHQTRQRSMEEVLAAYDIFISKLPNNIKVGVVGNSYGGYLAALISAKRQVSCISMRVPSNYEDEKFDLPQMNQGHGNPKVAKWRHKKLNHNETEALRAIHGFDGPVQIIEAEKDELIVHQTVQNYIDAVADKSQLEYHLMKGWPHSLGEDTKHNKEFQELLLKWAQKQVE
jgi:esterase/lipase